jgi:hypothetical protein
MHVFLYCFRATFFSVNSFSFDDCLFLFIDVFFAFVFATMLSRLITVLVRVEVRRGEADDVFFLLLLAAAAAASAFLSWLSL